MTYALREALLMVLEEGLDQRAARHQQMHLRLRKGLEAMDLKYVPKHSLHTLNCIRIPAGVDDAGTRRRLLQEYGIEISGGLGPLAGKTWRIGLMGHGAERPQCGPCPDGVAGGAAVKGSVAEGLSPRSDYGLRITPRDRALQIDNYKLTIGNLPLPVRAPCLVASCPPSKALPHHA